MHSIVLIESVDGHWRNSAVNIRQVAGGARAGRETGIRRHGFRFADSSRLKGPVFIVRLTRIPETVMKAAFLHRRPPAGGRRRDSDT